MRIFAPASARQTDVGLFVLRAVSGSIFAAHGAQKLFTFGLDGVAGAFGGMGVPMAGVVGPAVAFLEFFGGLALVAGLLTRLVGVGLAANMLGAILLVHLPNGLFLPNGSEFALALFGAAATLTMTGAGSFSVDAVLNRTLGKRSRTTTVETSAPVHAGVSPRRNRAA
jgi:putative oxidoreductase